MAQMSMSYRVSNPAVPPGQAIASMRRHEGDEHAYDVRLATARRRRHRGEE
jgi:hypothetical protein